MSRIEIAQTDAAQLVGLPGLGLKMVARLKDTFERPFCTGMAGDALIATVPCLRLRLPPQPLYPLFSRSGSSRDSGGLSRRMGIGVNTFWDVELNLSTPSSDPAKAAAMGHLSAGARGEGEPTVGHQAPSWARAQQSADPCAGAVPGESATSSVI